MRGEEMGGGVVGRAGRELRIRRKRDGESESVLNLLSRLIKVCPQLQNS